MKNLIGVLPPPYSADLTASLMNISVTHGVPMTDQGGIRCVPTSKYAILMPCATTTSARAVLQVMIVEIWRGPSVTKTSTAEHVIT